MTHKFRNPERADKIIGLAKDGKTVAEIMALLSFDRNTVSKTLCSARQAGLLPPAPARASNPAPIEALLLQGLPIGEVAALSGVVQVTVRRVRARLIAKGKHFPKLPRETAEPRNLRAVSSVALRAAEKRARDTAAPIAPIPVAPAYGLPCVSLEHVQDTDGCRFPIGTPRTPSFGFCGAEREQNDPNNPVSFWSGGLPYCSEHRHKTSVKTVRQIGENAGRRSVARPNVMGMAAE